MRRCRIHSAYFSDAVWGGRAKALVAAQRWRDELMPRIDPDTRLRSRARKGSGRATGIVGVSLERHVVEGRAYERYVAYWPDPERGSRKRRFLVERYGKAQARALAEEAREAGVARNHALRLALQREEAAKRLRNAPPLPRQVKDPLSRKGISMAARRPRRARNARS